MKWERERKKYFKKLECNMSEIWTHNLNNELNLQTIEILLSIVLRKFI